MMNCSRIAIFGPKMSLKAPRAPLRPPRTMKIIFFELPGYQNPMMEKRIYKLSPIGKKSDQTMRLAAMFDFWLWSSWLTIKKLAPKINLFYRPSGGQITKNLVGGVFRSEKNLHGPAARLI